MSSVLSMSFAGAAVASAAQPRVAARAPAAPAALRAARPAPRSLSAQMAALSVRPSVTAAATAAEPVDIEVAAEPVESPEEAMAVLRHARGAPNKVRRVLDTIRGRSYEEALMILEYMPYKACEPILKTLVSAASNAKNNYGMRKARLYVSTAYCDMAPPLKRVRARAQGKANKILKKNSHITIKVAEKTA
eukprot:jgi/Tetstr1/455042/TSEL_041898.t1